MKGQQGVQGVPWLEYDSRFRREAAANQSRSWAVIDSSSWTLCFANAKPKVRPTLSTSKGKEARFQPYRKPPVCRNFNNNKCELAVSGMCVQYVKSQGIQTFSVQSRRRNEPGFIAPDNNDNLPHNFASIGSAAESFNYSISEVMSYKSTCTGYNNLPNFCTDNVVHTPKCFSHLLPT